MSAGAQIDQGRMHPAGYAVEEGECAAARRELCGAFRHGVRLHSAPPATSRRQTCWLGRQAEILAQRDRRLEQARTQEKMPQLGNGESVLPLGEHAPEYPEVRAKEKLSATPSTKNKHLTAPRSGYV